MIYKLSLKEVLTLAKMLVYGYGIIFLVFFTYILAQKLFPHSLQSVQDISQPYLTEIGPSNLYLKFLLTVFYAPVMEELVFRSGISSERKYIMVMLAALAIYSVTPLTQGNFIFVILLCIYPILQIVLFKFLSHNKYYFLTSTIFSALLFAALHYNNFNHDIMKNLFSYIIMLSPLAILGFFLGRIRTKLGLVYAILGHIIINLIGFTSSV